MKTPAASDGRSNRSSASPMQASAMSRPTVTMRIRGAANSSAGKSTTTLASTATLRRKSRNSAARRRRSRSGTGKCSDSSGSLRNGSVKMRRT